MKHDRGISRSSRAVRVLVPVLGLLAAGCSGGDNSSDAAAGAEGASCYEGENVTFVVPYSPGGAYDVIARATGPLLEEELGARVVIENQPGAGGLTAANKLFTGEPDGKTFAIIPGVGVAGAALAGAQGVAFEPVDFTFVARVAPDLRVLTVGADSGLETIEDVQDADLVRFASTGPGGADHIDASVVTRILDIKGEIVTGYAGSSETELAVTAGDTDAGFNSLGSRLNSINSGDHRAVLIAGKEQAEALPDVPALLELDLEDDKRALAEAHAQLQETGRAIVAPPGVPENCVGELEAAFEAALTDPGFLEQMEKSKEPIAFLPGGEVKQLFTSVMEDSPEEYVELLKEAFEGQ
jgi:tripartite-type tricarboxylate transporter receptor subunit TctC